MQNMFFGCTDKILAVLGLEVGFCMKNDALAASHYDACLQLIFAQKVRAKRVLTLPFSCQVR